MPVSQHTNNMYLWHVYIADTLFKLHGEGGTGTDYDKHWGNNMNLLSAPDEPHVGPMNLTIRGGFMYVDCKWRCVVLDNGT